MERAGDVIFGVFDTMAKVAAMPKVYPGYIAFQIKKALCDGTVDPEKLLRSVGTMETLGSCRYAVTVKDFNGTDYRITVEVAKP